MLKLSINYLFISILFLSGCTLDAEFFNKGLTTPSQAPQDPPTTEEPLGPLIQRTSVTTFTGIESQSSNSAIDISKNGEFILLSSASALLPEDTNKMYDLYIYSRVTGELERVSVAHDGTESNNSSSSGKLSADGRFVVFPSAATNLVLGDTNGKEDIFVRDRLNKTTERVSINSLGEQADNGGNWPDISGDGRYIVFTSSSTNLDPLDTNSNLDIFQHDRTDGTTSWVSKNPATSVRIAGSHSNPQISSDGNTIIFKTSSNYLYAYKRVANTVELVNSSIYGAFPGGWNASLLNISANGRYVVFNADSNILVADDTNNQTDVFVRDLTTSTTELVSRSSDGTLGDSLSGGYGGSISDDGKYVVFDSVASNFSSIPTSAGIYQVYVHNRTDGTTNLVSKNANGDAGNRSSLAIGISSDGRYIALTSTSYNLVENDINRDSDAFYYDLVDSQIHRVNADVLGGEALGESTKPEISGDGRYVAFLSSASNIQEGDSQYLDVFVHDRVTKITKQATISGQDPGGNSYELDLSHDGNIVVFSSEGTNLHPNDTANDFDIFSYNMTTGSISLISISTSGQKANNYTDYPAISGNARYIAFCSDADNLVDNDTNSKNDIFVRDTQTNVTKRVSISSTGTEGNGWTKYAKPGISHDGRYIVFASDASNMIDNDTNNVTDIFVHDQETSTTKRVSVSSDGTQSNNSSTNPTISADGKFIAFFSEADNLVADDNNGRADVFIHELETSTTRRVSVTENGEEHTSFIDTSARVSLSQDGRLVSFLASDSNLVSDDTNGFYDVFVHDVKTSKTILVSVDSSKSQTNSYTVDAEISADGKSIAFTSNADNLVSRDENRELDVFVVNLLHWDQ